MSSAKPHLSVCAVIVTYQCGERVDAALKSILPQVSRVIVVDNGSGRETQTALDAAQRKFPDVLIQRNRDNLGLAAAQNQGIRAALTGGTEWILLMDDDSAPGRAMVETMLANGGEAAIIAPRYVEQRVDEPARYLAGTGRLTVRRQTIQPGQTVRDAASVIASGSMIHRQVFERIGPMRDGFFIDYVDHEFCLRARRAGFGIALVGDAVLQHQQGHKTRHEVAGREVVTANYGAARRYTITRNRIFTARLHGGYYLWLVPYTLATLGWDLLRILLLEDKRWAKLAAMLRGVHHGMAHPVPPLLLLL